MRRFSLIDKDKQIIFENGQVHPGPPSIPVQYFNYQDWKPDARMLRVFVGVAV